MNIFSLFLMGTVLITGVGCAEAGQEWQWGPFYSRR